MTDPNLNAPKPFHEWHEDIGDVLWWLWPIESAPYVGSPVCLGYSVEVEMTLATSQVTKEPVSTTLKTMVGGWPFDEDQEHRLFWTYLPDADELDEHIRDQIRGGPDPFKED